MSRTIFTDLELKEAYGLLKNIEQQSIKKDKYGLSYDEKTGAIVGEDGQLLNNKEIFSALGRVTKDNKIDYLMFADTNHYKIDRIKPIGENLSALKEAGIETISFELPENRTLVRLNIEGKKSFSEVTLEELDAKKQDFIEAASKNFAEKYVAARIYKEDKAKEVALEQATTVFNNLYEAKKTGMEVVFSEVDAYAKGDKMPDDLSNKEKLINKLYEIVMPATPRDRIADPVLEGAFWNVFMNLRDEVLTDRLEAAKSPAAIIRGAQHIITNKDMDERLDGKSSIQVLTFASADEATQLYGQVLTGINLEKRGINLKENQAKVERKLGTELDEKNLWIPDKIELSDYVFVSGDNGGKGAMYEMKQFIANNDDLYKFLKKIKERLDDKSGALIDEITADKAAEKESARQTRKEEKERG